MRLLKLLVLVIVMVCLTVTVSFAIPGQGQGTGDEAGRKVLIDHGKCADFEKDPIKALECRKEKVRSLLKEGKITKEQADEMTARIDEKIAKVKEFSKLTLPQKRARLMEEFKTSADKWVKEGKLTREKADVMIRDFNEKITKWDGSGYPVMHGKRFHDGKHHLKEHSLKKEPITT